MSTATPVLNGVLPKLEVQSVTTHSPHNSMVPIGLLGTEFLFTVKDSKQLSLPTIGTVQTPSNSLTTELTHVYVPTYTTLICIF